MGYSDYLNTLLTLLTLSVLKKKHHLITVLHDCAHITLFQIRLPGNNKKMNL